MQLQTEGSKILIYSNAVKSCEQMASKLDGFVYNRENSDKRKNLKAWDEGARSVLCAMSVLSTGLNVKNIHAVVHCGLP